MFLRDMHASHCPEWPPVNQGRGPVRCFSYMKNQAADCSLELQGRVVDHVWKPRKLTFFTDELETPHDSNPRLAR